jgi:hypothetical protein
VLHNLALIGIAAHDLASPCSYIGIERAGSSFCG